MNFPTPDFSTPTFSTMNFSTPRILNPILFNHEFFKIEFLNHGVKKLESSGLKSPELKGLWLKLGVEKFGLKCPSPLPSRSKFEILFHKNSSTQDFITRTLARGQRSDVTKRKMRHFTPTWSCSQSF